MSVQTGLLPICHVKGELQTFKAQAIKTLILRSINIDDGLHLGLEALIDKSGDEAQRIPKNGNVLFSVKQMSVLVYQLLKMCC